MHVQTDPKGWPHGMPAFPGLADEQQLKRWCRAFNGYELHGSFDDCAKVAFARPRQTLDDLLTEYFFEMRAARHRGDDLDEMAWEALLPHFRQMLGSGEPLPPPPSEPPVEPELSFGPK